MSRHEKVTPKNIADVCNKLYSLSFELKKMISEPDSITELDEDLARNTLHETIDKTAKFIATKYSYLFKYEKTCPLKLSFEKFLELGKYKNKTYPLNLVYEKFLDLLKEHKDEISQKIKNWNDDEAKKMRVITGPNRRVKYSELIIMQLRQEAIEKRELYFLYDEALMQITEQMNDHNGKITAILKLEINERALQKLDFDFNRNIYIRLFQLSNKLEQLLKTIEQTNNVILDENTNDTLQQILSDALTIEKDLRTAASTKTTFFQSPKSSEKSLEHKLTLAL